ncbi:hypothetical protein [uncultured Fusobacterium sp.]|uniref:hypothetical protein n=2 Tax=Fusobacterium TaxID=848 RepID=UPI002633E0D6|nr:hypothetical protein [uncultured Fusobacterium sp.]
MSEIPVIQNIPDIINTGKSLFEILKNIGTNEVIAGVGMIMGISGYSLRDLIGKMKMNNFVNKFKEEFKEVDSINEEQNNILIHGFVELEDYIKNCENLDQNVFDKISDLLINGIKVEDFLTREYIKILKQLSWLDLKILLSLKNENIVDIGYMESRRVSMNTVYLCALERAKEKNRTFPPELIENSVKKIMSKSLLSSGIGTSKVLEDKFISDNYVDETSKILIHKYEYTYFLLGELGQNITELIDKNTN